MYPDLNQAVSVCEFIHELLMVFQCMKVLLGAVTAVIVLNGSDYHF